MANKAKLVREALNMTPAEAGVALFGHNKKQAYDQWSQWENGTRNPSAPAVALFDLILFLSILRDPHKNDALDKYIKMLKADQSHHPPRRPPS